MHAIVLTYIYKYCMLSYSRNYEFGLMGVDAGFYMYDVVIKKFTFGISSPNELLFTFLKVSLHGHRPYLTSNNVI